MLGLRMFICAISARFFSPPEKFSFTKRAAKEASILRFSSSALTSCMNLTGDAGVNSLFVAF